MSYVGLGPKFRHVHAKKAGRCLGGVLAVFLCCLPLSSQTSQGTIQGGIFDQSGGAVAGATVSVIDVARGVTRALTTDGAGAYVATNVTPGTYTVRAEAKGFQSVEHNDVLVQVGQNIRVDLVLRPGEQTQTITVTGELPAIDTTDATLGGAITNQAVNALPLNGRNFERLLQLRPGVVTSVGSGQGTVSTNGRRGGNDMLVVEGIAAINPSRGYTTLNSEYRTGDANSVLPIDAIQEFNTEQNPKAEFGWVDGSVINVGVKSGTNSIHGTAYAFGRDASATDASNYFTVPGISGVTPATLEQFGATAGGPIIKDKLFWFAAFEGLRTTLTSDIVDTIPSDISVGNPNTSMVDACLALGPAKINPLSAQLSGLNPATCVVTPSSSTVENLFPYNPTPSTNFAPGLTTTGPLNNGLIKGDYTPGPHQHFTGFYFVSKSTQAVDIATGTLLPQWEDTVPSDVQAFDGSWTWTPNSTWVNDFRVGYSYLHDLTTADDQSLLSGNPWPTGYGLNTGVTSPQFGGLPELTISSFTGFLGSSTTRGAAGPEGDLDFVESVSHLHGAHAFKFGFEYMDVIYDDDSYTSANGTISFTTLENFLQGITNTARIQAGNPKTIERANWFAGYFQDDWRATTKLTLNLGLRYQYIMPATVRDKYIGAFNPNVNPLTTPAIEQVGPGEPIASLYKAYPWDFDPHFGMAWDVRGDGKTVVRAGASLLTYAMMVQQTTGLQPFGANYPSLGVNTSGTAVNAYSVDQLSFRGCGAAVCPGGLNWSLAGPVFPFPVSGSEIINGATYTGITCTAAAPCASQVITPNFRQPRTAEWNLDIQRAITNNLTVDVAYVGNHGFDEASAEDVNQPPIGVGWNAPNASLGGLSPAAYCLASAPSYANCGANSTVKTALAANETAARPYNTEFPYLNYITQTGNEFWSNYNALQLTVNERLSHGLSFLSGYTYSHALSMSDNEALINAPMQPDVYNPGLFYGNSNNDLRHRFTFSPTYLIPGMKSPGQMLEGWSLSGIVTLQDGLPWFPIDNTNDILGTGDYNDSTTKGVQTWNYSGPTSAFTSAPTPIPCYGALAGCTPYAVVNGVAQPPAECVTAAEAPYAGNSQLQQLALASLTNLGCYVQGGGILTPPAYGTLGNTSRNLFRSPSYYNVDLSVSKLWKFKERYSAQLRVEFFNLFNRADFGVPTTSTYTSVSTSATDPSGGGQTFGCSCATPDASNPVLGSGGPRHIQFGLKLTF